MSTSFRDYCGFKVIPIGILILVRWFYKLKNQSYRCEMNSLAAVPYKVRLYLCAHYPYKKGGPYLNTAVVLRISFCLRERHMSTHYSKCTERLPFAAQSRSERQTPASPPSSFHGNRCLDENRARACTHAQSISPGFLSRRSFPSLQLFSVNFPSSISSDRPLVAGWLTLATTASHLHESFSMQMRLAREIASTFISLCMSN